MLGNRAVWKKQIRANAIAGSNNCCSICGLAAERLICHDKWQYDDKHAVATLVGFEIHCSACDAVTHFGRAIKIATSDEERKEILLSLIAHLCRINKCPPHTAQEIFVVAMDQFTERSRKDWTITIAATLLKEYPELAPLPEFVPPSMNF